METQAEFARRVRSVDDEIARLLAEPDDRRVRDGMERLAAEHWLVVAGLSRRWGPTLYRRNRVLFRPLVLAHAATWAAVTRDGRWMPAHRYWDRAELEAWLREVDRDDEVELFQRLYTLVLLQTGDADARWRADLAKRFAEAPGRLERQTVLAKFQSWRHLDEPTALAMVKVDAAIARPFVLAHLPLWRTTWFGSTRAERWTELAALAKELGDEELYFALYRAHTPADEWRRELLEVARTARDAEALDRELQRRQTVHAGDQMLLAAVEVLRLRGEEAIPWAARNLFGTPRLFRDPKGYAELKALALERGWFALWAAAIRRCGGADALGREVAALVARGDDEALHLLRQLAGTGHEYNGRGFSLATVQPLPDDVAVALYRKWPDLLRGPYRLHVSGSWGVAYPKLLAAYLEAGDDEGVDRLASRMVLQHWKRPEVDAVIERLVAVYRALADEVFAPRAAAVLGALPAYSVWSYDQLVSSNALARLLFERSGSRWLDDPVAMRDLLESPQIHVQALAFRLLGRDDPRAVVLAAANLDLLVPTLLRPLHRRTRLAAFRALARAASFDEPTAQRVLVRARDAFDLPDRRYPKEALVGLVAEVLHRWPTLRGPREAPVVYRRAVEGA